MHFKLKTSRSLLATQRYYFVLRSANNEVMMTSELYLRAADRDAAILTIKRNMRSGAIPVIA